MLTSEQKSVPLFLLLHLQSNPLLFLLDHVDDEWVAFADGQCLFHLILTTEFGNVHHALEIAIKRHHGAERIDL